MLVHDQLNGSAHIEREAIQGTDLLIKANPHDQRYGVSIIRYCHPLKLGIAFKNLVYIFTFMMKRNLRDLLCDFTDLKKHAYSLL
ncbi:hypothetical protein D3C75_1133030 [compost metagenome]